MPITVQGPNGAAIDFPDGTDAATIDGVMKQHFGGQPAAASAMAGPAPAPTGEMGIDNSVRQVGKGVPVIGGLLDKANAATYAAVSPLFPSDSTVSQAPSWSERYSENLGREKAKDTAFEKQNPKTATALNVTGAVAGTLPLAATRIGAAGLGLVGSLPTRMALGTIGSGALGATDAAVRGESPIVGGGIGAGFGVVSPLAGKLVGAGVNAAGEALMPVTGPIRDYAKSAVNKVSRAFGDDAVAGAAGAERAGQLGPQGMLLDFGPNLRSQGEALATQPGSASKIVGDAVGGRFKAAGDRITKGVDETLGPPTNIADYTKYLKETRKEAADPLYEAFRSQKIHPTDELKRLAEVFEKDGLFSTANHLMTLEGKPVTKNFFTTGDRKDYPTAEAWDYVKQAIDGKVGEALRQGRNNEARIYGGLKRQLDAAIENHPDAAISGNWKAAREAWADRSKLLDAQEAGQGVFNKTQRPDELAQTLKEMSGPERASYLRGARDNIDEIMGNLKNDALGARTLFGKDWNKQKLEMVVGKEKAEQLLAQIERENTFAETYGAVQRGSQTRGRQAAGQEFPNKVEPAKTQFANPSVLGLLELGGRKGLDMLRSSGRTAALDREGADAARLLTAQGPQRDLLMEALSKIKDRNAIVAPVAENARDLATILMQSQEGQPRRKLYGPRV